nr:hypothetical protein [Tanacetum cinerariifolium]
MVKIHADKNVADLLTKAFDEKLNAVRHKLMLLGKLTTSRVKVVQERNLDNVSRKFLMYSRFIQTFLDKQLDGLPTHKKKYDVSFHTKKVFANMKRISKGFSGKETPLFPIIVRPNQVQMGEGSTEPIDTQHTPTLNMPPPKPKKTQKPRQTKRKTTKVPQPSRSTDIAADEAVHKEEGNSLVWATTTAFSLEEEQDSGNIDKTQTKATSNEPSSQGTSSGDGPKRQDTMRDTSTHTRYERVSKMSSGLLLVGVNTPQSDENSLKHIELMKIYTTLQKKVIDLEDELKRTKTTQQTKIDGLERIVKKLEKKHRSRTYKLKRLYKVGLTAKVISSSDDEALDKEDTSKQGRINEIDVDEDIALVSTHDDMVQDEGMEDVSVTETIVTTAPTITVESTKINVEVTQASKRKGVMIQEPEEITTTKTTSSQQPQVQDKARKLQEEIYEQERLVAERSRQEEEANNALIETWKYIQTKVDADYQLAERLQAEEQEQLTDTETKLVEVSTKKDEAETAQESSSKRKDEAETAQESSSKRVGDELDQERSKKQKVEDDKESEELKKCLEIIPNDGDEVTIDATPLSSKSPTIVDY